MLLTALFVLYSGDHIGVADNGDFRRVMVTNGLEYLDSANSGTLFKEEYIMNMDKGLYSLVESRDTDMYSSPHFIFIKAAKIANYIGNSISGRPLDRFNIAYLGIIYAVMLACAAFCLLSSVNDRGLKLQLPMLALFVFMFCDSGYLVYFNSLYGEPLQYVAFLILIGMGILMYRRPTGIKAVMFFLALYFFAGSKLANIPFALMISLLCWGFFFRRRDRGYRRCLVISWLVLVISACATYAAIPDWMNQDTTYQSVFFGILKESGAPADDMAEMGIDEKYLSLAGTNAYMPEEDYPEEMRSEGFMDDFYNNITKADVMKFYLSHPTRFIKTLAFAVENSAWIKPPYLGNSTSEPYEFTNKFSGWSHLRIWTKFLYNPFVTILLMALAAVAAASMLLYALIMWRHVKNKPRIFMGFGAFGLFTAGLWMGLVLPVAANGEADLAKHMFLFIQMLDILFAAGILWISQRPLKQARVFVVTAAAVILILNVHIPPKTVEIGMLGGKPIKWEVIKDNGDGTKLLIAKSIGKHTFDRENGFWEESDLRAWLNGEFFNTAFTDGEKDRIQPRTHRVLLPEDRKELADSGNHTHFWNHTKSGAGKMSDTAYGYKVTDKISLGDFNIANVVSPGETWIDVPYAGEGDFVRYRDRDGFFLNGAPDRMLETRPVILYRFD